MKHIILLTTLILLFGASCAQTIQSSSYETKGYIKTDGTVQSSSYNMVGYIKDDGTIQNSSYNTIGYAKGMKKELTAVKFFFFKFN